MFILYIQLGKKMFKKTRMNARWRKQLFGTSRSTENGNAQSMQLETGCGLWTDIIFPAFYVTHISEQRVDAECHNCVFRYAYVTAVKR